MLLNRVQLLSCLLVEKSHKIPHIYIFKDFIVIFMYNIHMKGQWELWSYLTLTIEYKTKLCS